MNSRLLRPVYQFASRFKKFSGQNRIGQLLISLMYFMPIPDSVLSSTPSETQNLLCPRL